MDRPADGPTGPADSAGVPWSGRTLPGGGFDGDDGEPDPALVAALDAHRAGLADAAAVVAALAAARVVVPVVAVLGEGEQATPAQGDKSADMALVVLTGPDGRRALPVFSGVAALQAWDAGARPVPVEARRAAASAVAERCDLLVVDPAGPVTFVVSRPAVWAVGQGRTWVPAHRDPEVAAELRAAVAGEPDVLAVDGVPGERAELAVRLTVRPGLSRDQVRALGERVGRALSGSDVVRERVDGVELALTSA